MGFRRFAKARVGHRHTPGEMNKAEAAYAGHLDLLKKADEVAEWWFERFTFKLAKHTHYIPDFVVQLPDGEIQVHEVKGCTVKTHKDGTRHPAAFAMEDSKAKIKVFAENFPFKTFIVYQLSREFGGGWKAEEVGA